MKTSHFSRDLSTCAVRHLFLYILFTFAFSAGSSHAQCFVSAGPDKVARINQRVDLQAFPQLKNHWKFHPRNTSHIYFDAAVINDSTRILVGSSGTILKISGNNEQIVSSGKTNALFAVDFVDDKNGIAVGVGDVILKTSDGGDSWNQLSTGSGYTLNRIQYLNAQIVLISGYNPSAPTKGTFFKSIDGGNSWTLLSEFPGIRVQAFDFVDALVGYATGSDSTFLKTTDGGANWKKLTPNIPNLGTIMYDIKAFNANVVVAVGNRNCIIRSEDGGQNWMSIAPYFVNLTSMNDYSLDLMPATYESVFIYSESNFMVSGYRPFEDIGFIIKTEDSGNSWQEELVDAGVKSRIRRIAGNTTTGMMAVGDMGLIYTKSGEEKFSWTPANYLSEPNSARIATSPISTTSYTVTRSTGSCSVSDDMTVFIAGFNDNVKNLSCGQSVLLDSIPLPTNFKGTVKYKWIPARGLNSDTIARPLCSAGEDTKYTATVILNDGNIYKDSVISRTRYVTVNSFTVDAGEDKILADPGSRIQLNAIHNYSGFDALSYKWYPSDGLDDDTKQNPIATASQNISYTVVVTAPSGCIAVDDVDITLKTFHTGIKDRVIYMSCGSSVTLDSIMTNYVGSERLRYRWTPSTGLSSDTVASPVCSATTSTTYTVRAITPEGRVTSTEVIVKPIPLKINSLTNKTFYCGQQVQLDPVTTDYTGTGKLRYQWTPATGLSNDTIPNPVVNANVTTTYTLMVTTPEGCSSTAKVTVTKQGIPAPSISGVSVDNQERNLIQWNIPPFEYDSLHIYKETHQLNQYQKIASVGKNISTYSDTLSQPKVMSNSYKIALLDPCGTETALSSRHKTIHLAINKGINNSWNLIWEPYLGFEVATYYIYRGTTANQLSLISSLSGANSQYSDFTAPAGDIYYQIEAVKSTAAGIPDATGNSGSQTFISRSNIAAYRANVGIDSPLNISNTISLTPNPARNRVEIHSELVNGESMKLTVYNLQGIAVKRIEMNSTSLMIDISDLTSGMYFIELHNTEVKGKSKLIVK